MILAHSIGKKNWQNGRTQQGPRPPSRDVSGTRVGSSHSPVAFVSRPDRPAARGRGLPQAIDIDDFDMPCGCSQRGGLAETHAPAVHARRSVTREFPGSAAVPCCRTNPAPATTGATSAVRIEQR